MHNNYYFLKQLSSAIAKKLASGVISECYSQSREELIIRFEIGSDSHYLKASLQGQFSCITVPTDFQRARKNSVDLFSRIIGESVTSVRQFDNERCFSLMLSNDLQLLFKMHGNRSNILLFEGETVTEIFKKNIPADVTIKLNELDRNIDWSFENFQKNRNQLNKIYFTFGKLVWQYLAELSFELKDQETQWTMIQTLRQQLEAPSFYIIETNSAPALSLLKFKEVIRTFSDPIKAVNEFYYTFTQVYAFTKEREQLLSALKGKLQSSKNYYEKTFSKLAEIQSDNSYKIQADLLMANMHAIPPKADKITVQNFYNNNVPIEIKLKKDQTPQKNAEIFYRKAKNQQTEIDFLQKALEIKGKEIAETEKQLHEIEQVQDLKSLRTLRKTLSLEVTETKDSASVPYHEFIQNGYRIWVGKNAEANDVLTLKYGFKEDLWLHAKDVAGSHVLIKHQAGKNFPKDVIERAAQLAAYNSKRKTDSLCPVSVTPKKFVRKRKGDPPGAVVVEREEVIMVEPKL